MEIKVVKNDKNVEIIRVGGGGNKKGLSKLSSENKKSEMSMGKISNKVLERIGGLENFVRRFNRLYPKFKFTMVDSPAPEPSPAPAPSPEPAPAPSPEPAPAPSPEPAPAPASNG